jgi:hypothetical protein
MPRSRAVKTPGKFDLECDGSIIMLDQVVGKIAPDYFSPEEANKVYHELVDAGLLQLLIEWRDELIKASG